MIVSWAFLILHPYLKSVETASNNPKKSVKIMDIVVSLMPSNFMLRTASTHDKTITYLYPQRRSNNV
jgi:hypothetical protein